MAESEWNRRSFLKALGTAVAAGVSPKAFSEQKSSVQIVADPNDPAASSRPASWAIEDLTQALKARRIPVVQEESARLRILAAGPQNDDALQMLRAAGVEAPATAEAQGIVVGN